MSSSEKEFFKRLQKYEFITRHSSSMLKLELEIGLETIWNSIMFWSGMASVFLCLMLLFEESSYNAMGLMFIISLFTFIVGFIFRKSTDNYYLMDFKSKRLYYHKHFFRSEIVPISKFDKIKAVAVNGIEHISEDRQKYWEHHIVIVLSNLQMLRITDNSISRLETYNLLGMELSTLFQCPFYKGKKSNVFVNKGKEYSAVVLYKKQSFFHTYFSEIVACIFIICLFLFF